MEWGIEEDPFLRKALKDDHMVYVCFLLHGLFNFHQLRGTFCLGAPLGRPLNGVHAFLPLAGGWPRATTPGRARLYEGGFYFDHPCTLVCTKLIRVGIIAYSLSSQSFSLCVCFVQFTVLF